VTLTIIIALLVFALLFCLLTLGGFLVGKFSAGVRQGIAESKEDEI
jgi:hypothetical protein